MSRSSETNSFADRYEMTVEEVAALPQVGDHVNLVDFEGQHELRGVVTSRLFVLGKDFTTVNIVVKDDPKARENRHTVAVRRVCNIGPDQGQLCAGTVEKSKFMRGLLSPLHIDVRRTKHSDQGGTNSDIRLPSCLKAWSDRAPRHVLRMALPRRCW